MHLKKCICGCNRYTCKNHDVYICGETGVFKKSSDKIDVVVCDECGLIRQLNPIELDYSKYAPTLDAYNNKTYEHEYSVSEIRRKYYGLISGGNKTSILDVGCGSGSFVDSCRNAKYDAYGCEIGTYKFRKSSKYIYDGKLEDINFPTDNFDFVTAHDVVEHVEDPISFLKEIHRITKQSGKAFIEIPRFYHESGKHHWKHEHIWMFDENHIEYACKEAGFIVDKINHPIEPKITIWLTKPEEKRIKLLYPPGMGDAYWSLVKTQGFLKKHGFGIPDVGLVCPRIKGNVHKRSVPFLKLFPFINGTQEVVHKKDKYSRDIWNEAYHEAGRVVFEDVLDHDYFIAYNGQLRFGKSLEKIDDIETNWDIPMFRSLDEIDMYENFKKEHGKYICFYFVFQGTYRKWTKEFSVQNVIASINMICQSTGAKPVFVGATFDRDEPTLKSAIESIPNAINMVGKTTVSELFGLLRGSELVVGYPSGLTIMSAHLGCKTICIWNNYYHRDFWWYAMATPTHLKNYFVLSTKGLSPQKLFNDSMSIMDETYNHRVQASVSHQIKTNNDPITIAFVLKSGGDFNAWHVESLQKQINANTKIRNIKFVCFSDIDVVACKTIKFKNNSHTWWNKLELFRTEEYETERIFYFDLDTIITGNLDEYFSIDFDFCGLKPWNPQNRESGMMASGLMMFKKDPSLNCIFEDDFKPEEYPLGDQQYITHKLNELGKAWVPLQNVTDGIYSFKRQCRPNKPSDAKIICFHGRPRPQNAKERWVKDYLL